MDIIVRELYDQNCNRTGAFINAMVNKLITIEEKKAIELQLANFAIKEVFPGETYSIFSNSETDACAITIVVNINKLAYTKHSI